MFVQFHLDSVILQSAIEEAPGVQVSIKHLDSTPQIPARIVFWATGRNLDAFERGMRIDDTVSGYRLIAQNDGEHLYRTRHPGNLPDLKAKYAAIREDGVLLSAGIETDGWTIEMLFPDRDAFTVFRETCSEIGLSVDVDSIYSDPFSDSSDDFALTEPQRNLLERAVEVGYFDIPRETTLQELGQQMNISGQAASERLRRGMETLVCETITEEELDAEVPDIDI